MHASRRSLSVLAALMVPCVASARAQSVIYATDFSTLDGWTVVIDCLDMGSVHWAADATPAGHPNGPHVSPPASLNFNNGIDYGGHNFTGPYPCGRAISPPIDLSLATNTPILRFWASWEVEWGCTYDVFSLRVRNAGGGPVRVYDPCLCETESTEWRLFEFVLDRQWGVVEIEFEFDAEDSWFNTGSGPFIDDVDVVDGYPVFCIGDGVEGACPCGNESAPEELAGCLHSQGTAARLRASGSASLTSDTLVLHGSSMPNQPVLYFQGSASHAAAPFGDGLLCTGGPFVRLGTEINSGGASSFPNTGDLPISVRGMVGAPGLRHYQARYRDPAAWCTPDNFNLTNAVTVAWGP